MQTPEPAVTDYTVSSEKLKAVLTKHEGLSFDGRDPFEELSNLMDALYLDDALNNENAPVRGSELCEMLGLFYDFATAGHQYH